MHGRKERKVKRSRKDRMCDMGVALESLRKSMFGGGMERGHHELRIHKQPGGTSYPDKIREWRSPGVGADHVGTWSSM